MAFLQDKILDKIGKDLMILDKIYDIRQDIMRIEEIPRSEILNTGEAI